MANLVRVRQKRDGEGLVETAVKKVKAVEVKEESDKCLQRRHLSVLGTM